MDDSFGGEEMLSDEMDATSMFTLVSQAHAVLSDPMKRSVYDMERGYTAKTDHNLRTVATCKQLEAEKALRLMKVTFQESRSREEEQVALSSRRPSSAHSPAALMLGFPWQSRPLVRS